MSFVGKYSTCLSRAPRGCPVNWMARVTIYFICSEVSDIRASEWQGCPLMQRFFFFSSFHSFLTHILSCLPLHFLSLVIPNIQFFETVFITPSPPLILPRTCRTGKRSPRRRCAGDSFPHLFPARVSVSADLDELLHLLQHLLSRLSLL